MGHDVHMYRGPILWGTMCTCTEDQSYGARCAHVQRTNPMGHDVHMYRGPILWGTMCTCTEDQSYGTVHVASDTYLPTSMYSISSEGSMSCTKRELNKQTYSGNSCQKKWIHTTIRRKNTEYRKLGT